MHELMNEAPCGFVAFDDDGTLVEINETLLTLLGYTRVELLGWHIDRILPAGGRIFYQTYIMPMLKVQGSLDEVYLALRTSRGEDLPVLMNAIRRERDGRQLNDVVCMRMIRRHEYEDQLLEARRLAEESSAAKARFLSMMSHDLRTPLTAIAGNADLLAAGAFGKLGEEQLAAVDSIREAAKMQTALISDILEYARLDSKGATVAPREVDLGEIVGRAQALVRTQIAQAGLTLTTSIADPSLRAMADPHRLQQILINLLTNAIKYTPSGGSIDVTGQSTGARIVLSVRDTGVGISPEDQQRIFSPFVQVDVSRRDESAGTRGVGLGLAISRELARAMGGDVTVTSERGHGSVFTLELQAPAAAAGEEEASNT